VPASCHLAVTVDDAIRVTLVTRRVGDSDAYPSREALLGAVAIEITGCDRRGRVPPPREAAAEIRIMREKG
jgi:hypothetical protein